jgi:hypothetical protein
VSRREHHLAVNAVLYAALIAFEQRHVSHHIAELRRQKTPPGPTPVPSVAEVSRVIEAVPLTVSKTAA